MWLGIALILIFSFYLWKRCSRQFLLCPSCQCQWERRYCQLPSVSLNWALIRHGVGTQCPSWHHVSFYFYIARFVWEEWLSLESSLTNDLIFFLLTNGYLKNRCDGCEMFPIIGSQFKFCDDFDFCEMCFKTRKHNTRHIFGRTNEPGMVELLRFLSTEFISEIIIVQTKLLNFDL